MSKKSDSVLTITKQERLANEILRDLDAITKKIEKLERGRLEDEGFVRAHVNVPIRFLHTTVALVEQTPVLAAMKKLNAVEGRDTLQFLGAFGAVHDRVMALGQQLKLNLKSRKARLAAQSLQIYRIARGLASHGKDPELAAYVAMLGRDLGPRGRPKKKRSS